MASTPYYTAADVPERFTLASADAQAARFRQIEQAFARVLTELALKHGMAGFGTDESTTADEVQFVSVEPPVDTVDAYRVGMNVRFRAAQTNTGAVTIRVDGGPVVPLVDASGDPLAAGALTTADIGEWEFDGTSFRMVPRASGTSTTTPGMAAIDARVELLVDAWALARNAAQTIPLAKLGEGSFTPQLLDTLQPGGQPDPIKQLAFRLRIGAAAVGQAPGPSPTPTPGPVDPAAIDARVGLLVDAWALLAHPTATIPAGKFGEGTLTPTLLDTLMSGGQPDPVKQLAFRQRIGAGTGSADPAAIDARVQALTDAWALVQNASQTIPAAKFGEGSLAPTVLDTETSGQPDTDKQLAFRTRIGAGTGNANQADVDARVVLLTDAWALVQNPTATIPVAKLGDGTLTPTLLDTLTSGGQPDPAKQLAFRQRIGADMLSGDTRGALFAVSPTLPTTATTGAIGGGAWAVEADAPTGVSATASGKVYLPDLRPSDEVDGVWIVSLVDGTEVAEVKFTWGGAGSESDQNQAERKYAPLKFVASGMGGTGVFVDAVMESPNDEATFIRLRGDNYTLPANSTARLYWSVVTGSAGSGQGTGTGGEATDLGVSRSATQVTVTSSTGADAILPAATATEAGVLTGTDKGKVDTALTAAATVDAGKVLTGATDASREARQATAADLTALAGDLADGARGTSELALKSELPTGTGTTNLGVTRDANEVTVTSSTGTDATLPAASTTQAGVMTGTDKGHVETALRSTATLNAGKVVTGATDSTRIVHEATAADLTALAGDLADGARGASELALKTELPTVNPTNLSVTRDANEVTVASSTGTDATLPAASTTQAGVMTAADKTRAGRSLESAATVNSGSVVTGAGGRNVRGATDADLDALAGDLASADRGTNELALKSEVVAGNTRGALLATSSTLPTAAVSTGGLVGNTWAVESGVPSGVTSAASSLHLPELRPSDEVDGIWVVGLVDGTEFSETKIPWGYAGETSNPTHNKYKYAVVKLRDAVIGGHAASFVDAVLLTNSLILVGVNTALPANSTIRVYLAVGAGAAASSGGTPGTGGEATDLGISRDANSVVITSSTGADATIPAASTTEAGVMTSGDKTKVGNALEAAAAVTSGSVVIGAGGRAAREATAADLTALAGSLAADARAASELALKSELPTVPATDLSVTRDATEVVVASSTGADATIPAASTTEAGVLTAADKGRVNNALTAAATVNSGAVVTGAGGRATREATAADLTALATALAADARGASELALKSELGSGVIRPNVTLIDDETFDVSGATSQNVTATLFDLTRAPFSGAILVFRIHKDVSGSAGPGIALCLTNEILGLPDGPSTAPSTADFDNALKFMIPRPDDHGWGHQVLYVWRHPDADKLWIAGGRHQTTESFQVDLIEYTIGGGGATDLSVTRTASQVTVASSSGTDAVLPAASATEAGVLTGTDKGKVDTALTAAATVDAGKFLAGATDASRAARQATDADLTALAGDLADGARGTSELALKSELPTGTGTTDLSVTRTATQMTVASSTGTDATLPAASTTQAGVLTGTDKGKVDNALTAAATLDAGKVVTGATDGSRAVREASDADLDSLAGDLASGDRGANELALKSELSGGASPTNLGVTRNANQVTVTSSTGTDAGIAAASTTEAGVLTAADKGKVDTAITAAATVDAGKFLAGASDGSRAAREASDADLDGLAGDLASGDRGGNELALKTELPVIPTIPPTNLGVTVGASQVTVTSSTGTDASIAAASTANAGVMSAADKGRVNNALTAAAAVGAGGFVTGAGGRAAREATAADLTALATALASGARGTSELALKSELGTGGTGTVPASNLGGLPAPVTMAALTPTQARATFTFPDAMLFGTLGTPIISTPTLSIV